MRRLCLDTDYLVALLRRSSEAVRKADEIDSSGAEVYTTAMNALELYLGAFRSKDVAKNVGEADGLLGSVAILDLTWESSRRSGEMLCELFEKGEPIDLRDAVISGIAIVNGCTLVTRNVGHFKRVVGLSIETW